MRRMGAVAGSAIFLVLVPGTVAGLVPWEMTRWRLSPPLLGVPALRGVGVLLIAIGAVGLLDSFARFALQGFGTPAPFLPPTRLVVSGWYRHVRNPIYVAGFAAILGQGLLFDGARLLWYAAAFAVGCHLVVRLYEEPGLRKRFGRDYDAYCAHVPRWIPRIRPWFPEPERTAEQPPLPH
jgi:protein-S-isoprenylcysteine O-methyltransferase Ste14